ncbi:hypothetical protein LuPra_03162 [Luteitalea pratensis]|uniref:Uncharacterized protein n=1 Tax=Luteitalea pratensis TaxID=1855912 RepID=A0A143PMV1_LUTPR|nr:hypothetical protein [Luteitalea pratensis]AMY09935.1 hypothetical protein LuPra_03162 [Luteitalea pratensis]
MANTITRRTALSLALHALAARAALARTGPTPFNLEALRMPIGDQVAELLPVIVGGFERGRLPDGMRVPADEALHVRYQRGSDVVIVDATLPATAADARAAVDTAAREKRDELRRTDRQQDLPRIVQDLRSDPAYVALGAFVAWSRGRYFFAARASSPHALAAFMQAFPH